MLPKKIFHILNKVPVSLHQKASASLATRHFSGDGFVDTESKSLLLRDDTKRVLLEVDSKINYLNRIKLIEKKLDPISTVLNAFFKGLGGYAGNKEIYDALKPFRTIFREDGERKKLALGYIEEENNNGNVIVRFGGPITDCTDPANRIKLSPSRSAVFSPYPARFEIFDLNMLKPYPKIKDEIKIFFITNNALQNYFRNSTLAERLFIPAMPGYINPQSLIQDYILQFSPSYFGQLYFSEHTTIDEVCKGVLETWPGNKKPKELRLLVNNGEKHFDENDKFIHIIRNCSIDLIIDGKIYPINEGMEISATDDTETWDWVIKKCEFLDRTLDEISEKLAEKESEEKDKIKADKD